MSRLADWFHGAFLDPSILPPISQPALEALEAAAEKRARSKPKLVAVHEAPSREEFAAWRNDPTTQLVIAALNRNAEECREAWMAASWEGGTADQRQLDALRERSDALLGFTADYEAFCETLGLEPERETNAE